KITPSDIDVAAATARRIPVTVIPPVVTEATADLHFGIMLALARRIVEGDRALRTGVFAGAQSMRFEGAFVWKKTIGLIGGGGRIGRAVAQRARGFSMRALYWGPRRIAGAALDVYEREPRVEAALVGMSNVVLTPHIGSAVAELRESMAHVVVDNIVAVLEARTPPNCWNPEIYATAQ